MRARFGHLSSQPVVPISPSLSSKLSSPATVKLLQTAWQVLDDFGGDFVGRRQKTRGMRFGEWLDQGEAVRTTMV